MPDRPSFATSPPELVVRFESVSARVPEAQRRQMFGYPALFLAGPFEPMPGRPMKGYAILPEDIVADDVRLESWVRRAMDHVATLPPKK